MSAQRDELLRVARAAEDPSAADEERVLRGLRSTIAKGQVTPVSERVEASLGAEGALPASFALPGSKLVGVVLTLLSLAAVVALVRQPGAERGRPAHSSAAEPRPTEPAQPSHMPDPADAVPEADHAPSAASGPGSGADAAITGGPSAPAQRAVRRAKPRPLPSAQEGDPRAAAELALLRRVQAALRRKDGASALSELQAYPHGAGALPAERDAARILALCLLGRDAEAREAAARFAREHPSSPQRAAVDGSCANLQRNDAP